MEYQQLKTIEMLSHVPMAILRMEEPIFNLHPSSNYLPSTSSTILFLHLQHLLFIPSYCIPQGKAVLANLFNSYCIPQGIAVLANPFNRAAIVFVVEAGLLLLPEYLYISIENHSFLTEPPYSRLSLIICYLHRDSGLS